VREGGPYAYDLGDHSVWVVPEGFRGFRLPRGLGGAEVPPNVAAHDPGGAVPEAGVAPYQSSEGPRVTVEDRHQGPEVIIVRPPQVSALTGAHGD